jgi:hypothetical protein
MPAVEPNHVVGLRIMELMRGGARREAKLMISEKIDAAAKAGARASSPALRAMK